MVGPRIRRRSGASLTRMSDEHKTVRFTIYAHVDPDTDPDTVDDMQDAVEALLEGQKGVRRVWSDLGA